MQSIVVTWTPHSLLKVILSSQKKRFRLFQKSKKTLIKTKTLAASAWFTMYIGLINIISCLVKLFKVKFSSTMFACRTQKSHALSFFPSSHWSKQSQYSTKHSAYKIIAQYELHVGLCCQALNKYRLCRQLIFINWLHGNQTPIKNVASGHQNS